MHSEDDIKQLCRWLPTCPTACCGTSCSECKPHHGVCPAQTSLDTTALSHKLVPACMFLRYRISSDPCCRRAGSLAALTFIHPFPSGATRSHFCSNRLLPLLSATISNFLESCSDCGPVGAGGVGNPAHPALHLWKRL